MQKFRSLNAIKRRFNKGENFIYYKNGKKFLMEIHSYGNCEGNGIYSDYFTDAKTYEDFLHGRYTLKIKIYYKGLNGKIIDVEELD